jgi:hypothetical protein
LSGRIVPPLVATTTRSRSSAGKAAKAFRHKLSP